jgi:hypothetical protein
MAGVDAKELRATQMGRRVAICAVVGFAIGGLWVVLAFVFFTAPQSAAADVVKVIAAITCPPFLITDLFVAPVLNAVLYGGAAYIWLRLSERWNRGGGPPD